MAVLACMMHWYASAMFVVPVLAVGGWSWWSTHKAPPDDGDGSPPAPSSRLPGTA